MMVVWFSGATHLGRGKKKYCRAKRGRSSLTVTISRARDASNRIPLVGTVRPGDSPIPNRHDSCNSSVMRSCAWFQRAVRSSVDSSKGRPPTKTGGGEKVLLRRLGPRAFSWTLSPVPTTDVEDGILQVPWCVALLATVSVLLVLFVEMYSIEPAFATTNTPIIMEGRCLHCGLINNSKNTVAAKRVGNTPITLLRGIPRSINETEYPDRLVKPRSNTPITFI